jgi:glucose-6-phosphate dehydrogenase assembly protein OpcA
VEEAVIIEPSKLERFSAGERFAVNPDSIERELASLWRAAGKSTETKNPVTRACLWNVVVHVEERPRNEGSGHAELLSKVVRDLPQYLAARALVLKTLADTNQGPELESWISANCILAGGGGKLVCSEEVAIAARGNGERHLPSLVRALLVPAVPTAVVFAGVPPSERPMVDGLIQAADRVVVHADHSTSPQPLRRIREVSPLAALGAIDLGWIEVGHVRGLVAGLFDPPTTEEDISRIERVTITSSEKHRHSSRLILAWIASALGGEGGPKKIGENAWRFQRTGRGAAIEAVHQELATAPWPSVELVAPSLKATFAVRASGEAMADVVAPHVSTKKPLGKPNPAALLARALATRAEDRSFTRTLQIACTM